MQIIKKLRFVVILLIFFKTNAFGQLDPQSSQYLSNQTLINPAYVGVHDFFLGVLSTRGQWVGIDGAPFTNTLSVSSSFNDQMGAGLVVINDNFGINTNLESILSYSYKIDWINYSVSFGLQGSFAHQRIDFSKLNQEVPDPSIPISAENVGTTNFGTGIFLAHEKYYIGLSVPRMLRTNLSPDNAREVLYNRHYYLSVGYIFDYVSFIKIKPSLLVKAVEGESVSIDLNGQVIISDQVWLGVAFNNLNAAGFNFQYVEGSVRFGYAFEIPVNSLASISFGTHELMIAVDANLLKKHKLKDRYY